MKILFCLNHFFPETVAGTEVYVRSLCKELQRLGADVAVLIPHYNSTETDTYLFDDISVHRYAEPSVVDRSLIMGRRKPDGLSAFEDLLKQLQPDVVHFHGLGGSNGITHHHVALAKSLGYKVIYTFHIAGLSCFTGNLIYKEKQPCNGYAAPIKCSQCVYQTKNMSALKTAFLTGAAKLSYAIGYDASSWQSSIGTAIGFPFVIAQRKKILNELTQHCHRLIVLTHWYKIVLELNGIPVNKLLHLPQALPSQHPIFTASVPTKTVGKLRLVFVGRVVESKGLHLLLAVVDQMSAASISLHIYGQLKKDAYANECLKKIDAHTHISWMGMLEPNKMVATLAQYDVLCIPSVICEMSPLVIQEAFAAGIPVIASDVYGNAEQIKHNENGWLFPFKNSVALLAIIKDLLAHPQKITEAARQLPSVPSFAQLANQHINTYQQLLQPVSI